MAASASERHPDPLVSIVAPVLDEEGCVGEFVTRTRRVLRDSARRFEILLVDDGSRDATPARIAEHRLQDPSVKSIRFTRSFGHQSAIAAGLRFARGDVVVTMDGDLQHPPELIPRLLERWRKGYDVVYAVRGTGSRADWKELLGRGFYRLMSALTSTPPVLRGADFRLMDRKAVDAFNALEERFILVRGLIPWLGFSSSILEYEPEPRFAGQSKFTLRSMVRLALDGIFSFSILPLRIITILGLCTTAFGILFGIFGLVSYLLGRVGDPGWTSIVGLILIFGGGQLFSIGILSEYVGRVYEEVKGRPRYVIESTRGIDTT